MSGSSGSIGVSIVVAALTSAVVTVATQVTLHRYGGVEGLLRGGPAAAAMEVPVPEVLGLSRAGADEVLHDRGLRMRVSVERHSVEIARGGVLEQDPLPGSRLLQGAEVQVVVSKGPAEVSVPDVIGQQASKARATLSALGLKVGKSRKVSGGDAGAVVEVVPAVGDTVMPGQTVVLSVAEGGLEVPDLDRMHISEARQAIEAAGLEVGRVRERYNPNLRAYLVLSQRPEAGTEVEPGDEVDLVINEGD